METKYDILRGGWPFIFYISILSLANNKLMIVWF